jgi:vitamin K-dependent gamma-carboxylase
MPVVANLRAVLERPVSLQSLVVVRVLFGAILMWDWWRYIKYDRIYRYYVEPDHFFPYFGMDWLQPLPEPWMHWVWHLVGLSAFLIMIGAFFRVAIWVFIFAFGYVFLLDRAQYLNHNYLVLLYAVLLALSPANKGFSVDAWLRPAIRTSLISNWPVVAIKVQTEIVLIFAGLVKITDDWLRGEPLGMWLRDQADKWPFGELFQYDAVILLGTWGTVALHLVGAPLLLWHRTRLVVFIVYASFHSANAQFFNIGIFPWITIAVTTIFFSPDWPQRLLRWCLGWFETLPERPVPVGARHGGAPVGVALMTFFALWFAVQVVLPVRQAFFPTLVGWSGDGHRFSWRMRIYDREAFGTFRIVSANGQVTVVDPYDWLSERQADTMLTRADMIHDFAAKIEAEWQRRGEADVAVFADVEMSLNGRPHVPFIDPGVDLTAVRYNWLGTDDWVLPPDHRVAEGRVPAWFPPLPLQKPPF